MKTKRIRVGERVRLSAQGMKALEDPPAWPPRGTVKKLADWGMGIVVAKVAWKDPARTEYVNVNFLVIEK